MKAMILAAGLGTRMRPLTDKVPKPLLSVGDSTLIELHLKQLSRAGIQEVVINVSHLAEQIMEKLGTGERYNLQISYSVEEKPLETAGGVKKALPLLGEAPFLLVNGDIWTGFPIDKIVKRGLLDQELAHLVLVANPEHNLSGDFSLDEQGRIKAKTDKSYTFSGISVLSPKIFDGELVSNRLGNLFARLIETQGDDCLISGQIYEGQWIDVGTPERLEQLRKLLV